MASEEEEAAAAGVGVDLVGVGTAVLRDGRSFAFLLAISVPDLEQITTTNYIHPDYKHPHSRQGIHNS